MQQRRIPPGIEALDAPNIRRSPLLGALALCIQLWPILLVVFIALGFIVPFTVKWTAYFTVQEARFSELNAKVDLLLTGQNTWTVGEMREWNHRASRDNPTLKLPDPDKIRTDLK